MPTGLADVLKAYDYQLPKNLIAQKPAHPRDSARLLVCRRLSKAIKFDQFSNLGQYLPKNSLLVFNQTKVLPARLILQKPTGGKVEILYIDHDSRYIKAIADRKLRVGDVISRAKSKIKFKLFKKDPNFYFLKPNFPISKIADVLKRYGQTPLPPYLKHSPLTEKQRRQDYQSIFAKQGLSVAAPTASLHFTRNLISRLKKQGIEVKFVTLNVNLGTFAPLKEENIKTGKLHSESYEIDKETARDLNLAKQQGRPIIAVGTTVVRTLESAAKNYQVSKLQGHTNLFIRPGFKFQLVDGLITNFHVPKSSLMMLVATLLDRKKLIEIYKLAIKNNYRFFSFGDAMAILPVDI